jgi:large subunit ribosomal protein L15
MAEAKTTKASTAKTATKSTASASKSAAATKKPAAKATTAKKATTTTKTTAAPKKPAAAKATPAKSTAAKKPAAKKSADESKQDLLRLHHLKPAEGAHKSKIRVGRGEASKGKTAGRGTKGTKARYQVKVGFEGGQMPLHMRLPKLRGFKNPFRVEFQIVNLDRLEKFFPEGGKVGIEELILKGLVRNGYPVKVLGEGELTKKFDITADAFSKSAITKIEKAGGSVTTSVQALDKAAAELDKKAAPKKAAPKTEEK